MPITKSALLDQEVATSTPRHREAQSPENFAREDVDAGLAPGDLYQPTQLPGSVAGRLKEAAKSMLPDSVFLRLLHHKCIGRYPNLVRPTTFNEKILQRNLRPDPRYISLTDKLAVREYVAAKIEIGRAHV